MIEIFLKIIDFHEKFGKTHQHNSLLACWGITSRFIMLFPWARRPFFYSLIYSSGLKSFDNMRCRLILKLFYFRQNWAP